MKSVGVAVVCALCADAPQHTPQLHCGAPELSSTLCVERKIRVEKKNYNSFMVRECSTY